MKRCGLFLAIIFTYSISFLNAQQAKENKTDFRKWKRQYI